MTVEEKKALQMVLMDELTMRQQSDPTLLIDVLLSGDGPGFIRQILTARSIMGRNMVAMNEHLLRAVDRGSEQQPLPLETQEPAWQQNGAAAEA